MVLNVREGSMDKHEAFSLPSVWNKVMEKNETFFFNEELNAVIWILQADVQSWEYVWKKFLF